MELKKCVDAELQEAREYVRRCIETLTSAQERVEKLERITARLSDGSDYEDFVAALIDVGVVEEPRPF